MRDKIQSRYPLIHKLHIFARCLGGGITNTGHLQWENRSIIMRKEGLVHP